MRWLGASAATLALGVVNPWHGEAPAHAGGAPPEAVPAAGDGPPAARPLPAGGGFAAPVLADPLPVTAPAAAAPAVPAPVDVFYSPDYALARFSFETTRKATWVADSLADAPVERIRLVAPAPAAEADLLAVHRPGYVAAVRSGRPPELAQSQGFTWDPGLWPMVLASNGGAVAAALSALDRGVAGSLSSGLHHAAAGQGRGFCTFNGLALAARAAVEAGASRVLILDLDAHCGGGTHSLVAGMEPVWHADVSVNAFDAYTAGPRQSLDTVTRAADYLPTVERRLAEVARAWPTFDLCLYNAGMDPHQNCPVGGLAGVNAAMLAERERLVFDWCRSRGVPVAFVLAGGYTGPRLDESALVALHRLTLTAAAGA